MSTDAPQLIENNQKLDELILKVDTKLDVAISSRLADADYIVPATPQNVLDAKDEVLNAIDAIPPTDISGLALQITSESIKAKTDRIEFNAQNHIAANVHQLQARAISDIQDGLALETTSQEIKTKVNSLENADFTPVLETIISGNTEIKDIIISGNTEVIDTILSNGSGSATISIQDGYYNFDIVDKAETPNFDLNKYGAIYGGSAGCSVTLNKTDLEIAPGSIVVLNVKTISGGSGCYLLGVRLDVVLGSTSVNY